MASGAASSLNLGRCLFLLFDESAHANEATFHQTLSRVGRSRHRRSGNGGRDRGVGVGPQGRGAASGVTPLEHAIVSLDSHLVQMDTAAVRSLVLLPVVEKFMHLQRASARPAARKTKKKTKGRRATNPDNANAASSSSSSSSSAAASGSGSASALASSRRRDIIGRRSRVLRAILWLCLHPSGGVAQSFGQILSSSDDPSTTTATDTSANTSANTSTSTSTPASTAGAATGGVGGARSSGEDGGEGGGGGGGGDSGVGGGSKMRATDASSGDNRLRLVVVEMILAYESERREREKGTNAYCAPPHP